MTDLFDLGLNVPEQRSPRPSEPIIRSAEIDGPYRWSMTRAWGAGPTIAWVLFNPSDADGKRDDPTTQRMMGFSYRWGFGSMLVLNTYPFVASKPTDLHAWRRTFDHKAHEDLGMPLWDTGLDRGSWAAFLHNQRVVSGLIREDVKMVAAWGHGPTPEDLENFLLGVQMTVHDDEHGAVGIPPEWHCLGTNLDGSPVHPLARGAHRIDDNTTLKPWRMP